MDDAQSENIGEKWESMPKDWIYQMSVRNHGFGKKRLVLHASEPCIWPCAIAWYRLESVSMSLADWCVSTLSVYLHGTAVTVELH